MLQARKGKKKKKSSGSAVTAGALLLAVGEQEIDGWRTMKAEGARGPLPAMAASVYTSTAHMLSCALALRRARATHVAFGVSLSLSRHSGARAQLNHRDSGRHMQKWPLDA